MKIQFEVWRVPIPPEGNFLYKEERRLHVCANEDDAKEFIYFENADDPAPDKGDYRRFEIRTVPK